MPDCFSVTPLHTFSYSRRPRVALFSSGTTASLVTIAPPCAGSSLYAGLFFGVAGPSCRSPCSLSVWLASPHATLLPVPPTSRFSFLSTPGPWLVGAESIYARDLRIKDLSVKLVVAGLCRCILLPVCFPIRSSRPSLWSRWLTHSVAWSAGCRQLLRVTRVFARIGPCSPVWWHASQPPCFVRGLSTWSCSSGQLCSVVSCFLGARTLLLAPSGRFTSWRTYRSCCALGFCVAGSCFGPSFLSVTHDG